MIMMRLSSFLLLLYYWQTIASSCSAQEEYEDASEAAPSNFTKLFLGKVLREIDAKKNWLLAPHEIQKVYDRLRRNATNENDLELDNTDGGDDGEGDAIYADNTNPIKVCNSILRRKGSKIIVNSVTLRTRWAHNFQTRDTHKHHFRHAPDMHEAYTDAMNKDAYFPYASLPELNATALELSLEGRHIRMLVLLPDTLDGLALLAQRLLGDNLKLFSELMSDERESRRLQSTLVRVKMPKFSITHRESLNAYYASEIFSEPLTLPHEIYQETHIKVNEHGIGDMERTNVLFWNAYSSLRVAPQVFDMNHPFLFFICDSNGLQFVGQLAHIRR